MRLITINDIFNILIMKLSHTMLSDATGILPPLPWEQQKAMKFRVISYWLLRVKYN